MNHRTSFRLVVALCAFLLVGCAGKPKLQQSSVENNSALERYLQLYPGPAKDVDTVAVLAGYAGFGAERKTVQVGRIERVDSGDIWSLRGAHAVEILPGQYKVHLRRPNASWTADLVAKPGIVYSLVQDGWTTGYTEVEYPRLVPTASPAISVTDIRKRISKNRARYQQPNKPPEGSRHVLVLAGVSMQSTNRVMSIAQWERLEIGKHSRGTVERYLGAPSRVSKDDSGNDVSEYDGIVFATEREERIRSYSEVGRTLRIRFDADGKIAEVFEP